MNKTKWYKTRTAKVAWLILFAAATVVLWEYKYVRTPIFLFAIYQLVRGFPELMKK